MAKLYTNSASVKKGIDYLGIAQYGNAFQLTDETRVSINHTPFAQFPKYQSIFISPDFVYTFEEDTVVLVANEIVPEYGVVTSVYSTDDITLVTDVESIAIVSLEDRQGKEVTAGNLSCSCYVYNDANQPHDVILRLYGSTVGEIGVSQTVSIPSNSGEEIIHNVPLDAYTLPAGEVLSFTAEADGADCQIQGHVEPSHLRLERRNLY